MNIIQVVGRIPVIRDKLPFVVKTKDGRNTTITAREALQIENAWQRKCNDCRIDDQTKRYQGFFAFIKRFLLQVLYP